MVYISSHSNSKEDTFNQCKLKYKLKYVDYIEPIDEVDDSKMIFGSFIHKIFEIGYKASTFKELEDIAEKIKDSYKFNKKLESKIHTCFKNFLAFSASLPKDDKQPLPEWYFGINLNKDLPPYKGVIDRVIIGKDGGLLVIDWKTGDNEKSKIKLYNDTQLQGYALAASIKYKVPISKITCSHYYPTTDHFVNLKYTKSQIASFVKERKEKMWIIRKLKKDDLLPCRNEYCNTCEYRTLCPLFGNNRLLYEKLTKDKKDKVVENKFIERVPELIDYVLL